MLLAGAAILSPQAVLWLFPRIGLGFRPDSKKDIVQVPTNLAALGPVTHEFSDYHGLFWIGTTHTANWSADRKVNRQAQSYRRTCLWLFGRLDLVFLPEAMRGGLSV